MNIIQDFLPTPSLRRSGQKNTGIKFIVDHDTGNFGSTARQNVDYYKKSANDLEASAHFFVDDKEIICCIPEDEKAWHVRAIVGIDKKMFGVGANSGAIGIELCFGGNIDNMAAYRNYVELNAYLCKKYKIDPTKGLVGHYTLDPSRRQDPINAFSYIKKDWITFVQDVKAGMSIGTDPKKKLFPRTLRFDMGGPDVTLLQSILRKEGYFHYPSNTGYFGAVTRESVCYFQASRSLDPDGIVGPKTIAKLLPLL